MVKQNGMKNCEAYFKIIILITTVPETISVPRSGSLGPRREFEPL